MNEIASRYAEALYSLKKEDGTLLNSQQEAKELLKIIKDNPDFVILLSSFSLNGEEKEKIIDETFKSIDEDIKNLMKIVVKNHRARYLKDILITYNSLINEYRGVREGLVYSTEPLNEEQLLKITSAISEKEKFPVELINIIDPDIIGGVKVVINDHIYDGSLKYHIEHMKLTLLKKEGE